MKTGKTISDQRGSISNSDFVNIYQIKVKSCLDSELSYWFEKLIITHGEGGTTFLTGPVVDDAALHGLLNKTCDSGSLSGSCRSSYLLVHKISS